MAPQPARPRRAQFYVLPGRPVLAGAGAGKDQGPCIVLLVSTKWTRFLRERAGVVGEPVFEREALSNEPDTHANGHPYGWLYSDVEQALADERRLLAGQADLAQQCCDALRKAVDEISPVWPAGVPGEIETST